MLTLEGKYNDAIIYTDNIDNSTIKQVIELLNTVVAKDSTIRIMPDCHAGAGCVIGTTMTITDKIVPNLVGVDIGCGVFTVKIPEIRDLERFDNIISEAIPSGTSVRSNAYQTADKTRINDLLCKNQLNMNRAYLSVGTLGGGNHFIEIDKDNEGIHYLIIHSGSRNLGKQIATYYQNIAKNYCIKNKVKIPKPLMYLENEDMGKYLYDMRIIQEYAKINRETIAEIILKVLDIPFDNGFHTIHNYIDMDNMILRKGAISAQKDELVLIPLNMRDGSLLCECRGNSDWNYSAPHGAGRVLSRREAKEQIKLDDFKESMKGIFTTSVNQSTIDESPFAYKPTKEIIKNISDTVDIVKHLKPIYNYKS